MEEQIKTTLPEEVDKSETDDGTRKVLLWIFLPLFLLTILSFKFNFLRLLIIICSVLLIGSILVKDFKKNPPKLELNLMVKLIQFSIPILALFLKFFSDLILSYITLFFFAILYWVITKNEDIKIKVSNFIFWCAVITAIILNYTDIILFCKKLINTF